MDEQNITVILRGGSVEYAREEAEVAIEDLIEALQNAQGNGATHVVMSSGNFRGAQWSSIGTDWDWIEE